MSLCSKVCVWQREVRMCNNTTPCILYYVFTAQRAALNLVCVSPGVSEGKKTTRSDHSLRGRCLVVTLWGRRVY